MREYCPIPCAMLDFTLGWADTASLNRRPDQGYLRMYFRSSVQLVSFFFVDLSHYSIDLANHKSPQNLSYLEYTPLSMIADIGGFVGLFLGLSVVDVRLLIGR